MFTRYTPVNAVGLKALMKSTDFIKNLKLHEKKFIEILFSQLGVPSLAKSKAVNSWNFENLCKILDAVISYSPEFIQGYQNDTLFNTSIIYQGQGKHLILSDISNDLTGKYNFNEQYRKIFAFNLIPKLEIITLAKKSSWRKSHRGYMGTKV